MQEENTVQEQEQTPRVSRVREYMTAKFPDREFGDDSELEQALYDYLTQSDKDRRPRSGQQDDHGGRTSLSRICTNHRGRGQRNPRTGRYRPAVRSIGVGRAGGRAGLRSLQTSRRGTHQTSRGHESPCRNPRKEYGPKQNGRRCVLRRTRAERGRAKSNSSHG